MAKNPNPSQSLISKFPLWVLWLLPMPFLAISVLFLWAATSPQPSRDNLVFVSGEPKLVASPYVNRRSGKAINQVKELSYMLEGYRFKHYGDEVSFEITEKAAFNQRDLTVGFLA
ncbi:MAG: hypothetical protein AAF483_10065 [Planctomycetota bacterium]